MKLITQFDTKKPYFLDDKGFLYTNNYVKMKSTSIYTVNGVKTMTRDKWISVVYLGAPVDGNFYTKRKDDGTLSWKLNRQSDWVSLNTYVPEIDDNRITYFYYLCNSNDGIPKYIGKTIDPKTRFKAHHYDLKRVNNHKTNWINKVIQSGGTIEMHIIDELVPDGTYGSGDWRWLEEYWGQQFISWGFDIILDGGWGNGGMKRKATEEEKMKQRNIHSALTGKECFLYDIYNKTHQKFQSKRDACRFLINNHKFKNELPKVLKSNITIDGTYYVSDTFLTSDELYTKLKEHTNWDMKVLQMSMDFTHIIGEYKTAREAARVNNCSVILGVINPKEKVRKSALGYRWVTKLDYIYKGVNYLKKVYGYTNNEFIYTKELIDDCLSNNFTYKELSQKYKVSTGTIGNIIKDPNKFYLKIGLSSTLQIRKNV